MLFRSERCAEELRQALERHKLLILLDEDYDTSNAILTVHAGSGGLDSQDWAEMLLRMYLRYAEREGLKATVLEAASDEEAGIKSATVMVEGDHAYGFLKAEKGVHRLVRISLILATLMIKEFDALIAAPIATIAALVIAIFMEKHSFKDCKIGRAHV